ncbi:MAG: phosphate butyryltransferase [Clostridiaceae bacterium]|nr:phosphate butyryltransferase [Clostridiaceae bacterium]
MKAEAMGLVQAFFYSVGDPAASDTCTLFHTTEQEAAMEAVSGVHAGQLDMIFKGKVDTAVLLKEVVNKKYGLLSGRLISHIALLDVPRYHKMLLLTDGGMVMYPDLEQLRGILENAVGVMHRLGVAMPKVACLAAVEKVHDRMPETISAAALKEMNQQGVIQGCLVEGPVSFDLAFDRQAAGIKGYDSPVAGDADIFLVPDFVAGNLLAKSLVYGGGARFAGFLSGARAPVILTSRSSSMEEKLYSIACSAFVSSIAP